MVQSTSARWARVWFPLPVLFLKPSWGKGGQQCKKSDRSCQLVWKWNQEIGKGGELVSEGEVGASSWHTSVAAQATTSQVQVGGLFYDPPRVGFSAVFQHLVMYFGASSVTTKISTSTGNPQPRWGELGCWCWCWPSADPKPLAQLQGETFLTLKSGPPVAAGFMFHLRGSLF